MTHIPKGAFKRASHNPNARATQNYSVVEYLSQTLLSLKFRPHVATRTPHRQNRTGVIHGTGLMPQHCKRVKKLYKMTKNLKGALQHLGARAYARNRDRTKRAYVHKARLLGEKPARLLNGAFIEIGRPPNH
jgi:hypothetical protein